jgi:hypothetical protein
MRISGQRFRYETIRILGQRFRYATIRILRQRFRYTTIGIWGHNVVDPDPDWSASNWKVGSGSASKG